MTPKRPGSKHKAGLRTGRGSASIAESRPRASATTCPSTPTRPDPTSMAATSTATFAPDGHSSPPGPAATPPPLRTSGSPSPWWSPWHPNRPPKAPTAASGPRRAGRSSASGDPHSSTARWDPLQSDFDCCTELSECPCCCQYTYTAGWPPLCPASSFASSTPSELMSWCTGLVLLARRRPSIASRSALSRAATHVDDHGHPVVEAVRQGRAQARHRRSVQRRLPVGSRNRDADR